MAIASVNAASSTGANWLKEAQASIAASASPGGLLGTLQDARSDPSSLKTFLARSTNATNSLALIAQNGQSSAGALASQMAASAAQKRQSELIALVQKLNPVQTNYTPPAPVDAVYFENGGSLDTSTNILTMANGTQIDTTTGLQYHEPGSIVSMANGAYLDTKNNILTMSDGTKIDTVTGLTITSLICVTSSEHGRRFDRRRLCRRASRSIAAGGRRQDAAHEHAGVGRYRQASGSRAAEFQSSR